MKYLKFFLMAGLVIMVQVAFASGGETGGGGKGVVCRNTNGSVQSIELLDLWEARVLYNRNVVSSSTPLAIQVRAALSSLANAVDFTPYGPGDTGVGAALNNQADLFLKNSPKVLRLRGVTLTPTPDSYEAAYPNTCKIEQIVNYKGSADRPNILVNQDLWDKLTPTGQAALIVHESFYSVLRNFFGETDSIRTRRLVGYVFSGNLFQPLSSVLPSEYIVCESQQFQDQDFRLSRFYFYTRKDGALTGTASFAFGSPAVGFFPPLPEYQETIGNSLNDILTDQWCAGAPANSFVTAGFTGSGPIDYDKPKTVRFFCTASGKLNVYAVTGGGGATVPPNPATNQALSCHLERH